jgi:hypothetical protein
VITNVSKAIFSSGNATKAHLRYVSNVKEKQNLQSRRKRRLRRCSGSETRKLLHTLSDWLILMRRFLQKRRLTEIDSLLKTGHVLFSRSKRI